MKYFGVNYCKRKSCGSWLDWAWWIGPHRTDTYFTDIKYVFFARIVGLEFQGIKWLNRSERIGPSTIEIWRPTKDENVPQFRRQ